MTTPWEECREAAEKLKKWLADWSDVPLATEYCEALDLIISHISRPERQERRKEQTLYGPLADRRRKDLGFADGSVNPTENYRTATSDRRRDTRVCHAPGDKCAGCPHYHGKAPVCTYADRDMVMVPREPTAEMVRASLHIDLSYMPTQAGADRAAIYRAMLAASEKP